MFFDPVYWLVVGIGMAAFGVAAHEVGHAIQDADGYAPLKFRSAWVPVANLGSGLSGSRSTKYSASVTWRLNIDSISRFSKDDFRRTRLAPGSFGPGGQPWFSYRLANRVSTCIGVIRPRFLSHFFKKNARPWMANRRGDPAPGSIIALRTKKREISCKTSTRRQSGPSADNQSRRSGGNCEEPGVSRSRGRRSVGDGRGTRGARGSPGSLPADGSRREYAAVLST